MLAILSLLAKLAGVGFLFIAALGVMRLSDPFQRMHAATKAGTLGAGLVILGSIISQGAADATVIGMLAMAFLLLTVPVAGHLLGRAFYVSGARLALRGGDALDGILERSSQALDERMAWQADLRPTSEPPVRKGSRTAPHKPRPTQVVEKLPALSTVRFAVIAGRVEPIAERAFAIAKKRGALLSAHILIDRCAIDTAEDQLQARTRIRTAAGEAIRALKTRIDAAGLAVSLNYDEGDPEQLLASTERGGELLILPCEGWFHHQVKERRPLTTWEPDGLLRLPLVHRGPVLYCADAASRGVQTSIVLRDCGEPHLPGLLDWALAADLWPDPHVVLVSGASAGRIAAFDGVAAAYGCSFEHRSASAEDCTIPASLASADAVILGAVPRPLRTAWYGLHWRDRIAPAMRGDVLVMEAGGSG